MLRALTILGEITVTQEETKGPMPEYFGPNGFHWLIPGLIGGSPQPGIMKLRRYDLEALQRVGTNLLISLTEEWVPDAEEIAQYGMASHYVPVTDLHAPTLEQAVDACEIAAEYIAKGKTVVYHCRAGKGRTGVMMAAQLIWIGNTAEEAVEYARQKNPKWIESDSQMKFLDVFEDFRLGQLGL